MAKLGWNRFIEMHGAQICVACSYIGPASALTSDGRKVPTPYDALGRTIGKAVEGDWTAKSKKLKDQTPMEFLIEERDLERADNLLTLAPILDRPARPYFSRAFRFVYEPKNYHRLLVSLGYASSR